MSDVSNKRVGIIGLGRAGCAFATGFFNQNINVVGVNDKNEQAVKRCTDNIARINVLSQEQIIKKANVIFLTVNDDSIKSVAESIAKKDVCFYNKLFVHISGASGLDVLEPISKKKGNVCSLHPLQTFADYKTGWRGLFNIYFGYTGKDEYKKTLAPLIEAFNGKILDINEGKKPLYHAAACVFSNYTVALYDMAEQIAEASGIKKEEVLAAYKPLIEKTVSNILQNGSLKALTGPISRGDINTIKRHLECIDEKQKYMYKVLGLHALSMAQKNNTVEDEDYLKIKEILKDE